MVSGVFAVVAILVAIVILRKKSSEENMTPSESLKRESINSVDFAESR